MFILEIYSSGEETPSRPPKVCFCEEQAAKMTNRKREMDLTFPALVGRQPCKKEKEIRNTIAEQNVFILIF